MGKVTYLDDLQQMQADHIWGKVRKMRKQKVAKEPKRRVSLGVYKIELCGHILHRGDVWYNKPAPYTAYRSKVANQLAGRAAKVAHKLISLGDY